MKPEKKSPIPAILSILSLLVAWFAAPQPVQAQAAGTAWEMLAEINAYRAANGLAPIEENIYLNLAAQGHADWIAETGLGGHTGEGGGTATDRARAVGYDVSYVTENWAEGVGLTVSACIYTKWSDAAHTDNMLDPNRKEFGAGVAVNSSGVTIYVVDFSNFDTDGSQPADTSQVTPSGPTATTAPLIQPLIKATPGPDGTVIHIVQYGQTLWTIAEAYGIPLADLLALNNLTEDSAIYPDEELLIVQGTGVTATPTPTEILTEEATLTPLATMRPTATQPAPTPTPTPEPRSNFLTNIFSGDTLWVGIGLVAVSLSGIGLLLYTSYRLR